MLDEASMKITKEQEHALAITNAEAKAQYENYTCPYCRKFILWDVSHSHKEGSIVQPS